MRRGVVFTIDALLALSIFIGALIAMYGYFGAPVPFQFSGVNVYSQVDNYFYAYDNAEEISEVVKEAEVGNTTNAKRMLDNLINQTGYSSNVEIFVYNNGALQKIVESKNYTFDEFFVVRKYLVLTLDEGLTNKSGNVSVEAPSSLAGKAIPVNVTVRNPTSSSISVNVSLSIYNSSDDLMSWNIDSNTKSLTVPANSQGKVTFLVEVPSDTFIGEYRAYADVTGGLNEDAWDVFNVIKFGVIHVEVGI